MTFFRRFAFCCISLEIESPYPSFFEIAHKFRQSFSDLKDFNISFRKSSIVKDLFIFFLRMRITLGSNEFEFN